MILRDLQILLGLTSGGHCFNNIKYRDDTVLMADTEILQKLLHNLVKESEKKGREINRNKVE